MQRGACPRQVPASSPGPGQSAALTGRSTSLESRQTYVIAVLQTRGFEAVRVEVRRSRPALPWAAGRFAAPCASCCISSQGQRLQAVERLAAPWAHIGCEHRQYVIATSSVKCTRSVQIRDRLRLSVGFI